MTDAQLWQDLIEYLKDTPNARQLLGSRLIASDDHTWTILVSHPKHIPLLNALRPHLNRTIRQHFSRFISLHFVSADDLHKNPALLHAALQRTETYQPEEEYKSLTQLAAELEPISWLWPSWIPRGMLTLLGASPGAGKSLLALDLCRRIIHNTTFPDGTDIVGADGCPPSLTTDDCNLPTAIYVDAEAIPQIQLQRAQAWNMTTDNLYLMLPPATYGMIDFTSTEHQDRLIDMAYKLNPQLIVIDSLSSISVRGENNVEDVRCLLGFLSAVAREFNAGLLLVHHLRKRSALPSMDLVGPDDFRGSSHIIAMARSVLALSVIQESATPDRNGPRRLEIVKTNLCQYPKPLGLLLKPDQPGAPTLQYTDPPTTYREPTQTDECGEYLLDLIEERGEPVQSKEAYELLKEAGFSKSTIYRARKDLEGTIVNTEASSRNPANRWTLSAWDHPEELDQ